MAETLSLPSHDGGPVATVPARTVATWPEGTFVENVAVAPDGTIFVTIHPPGEIHRVDLDGSTRLFAKLPTSIVGIAFDTHGTLFVGGGTPGTPGGVIWRVAPDGTFARWIDLPEAPFLNGVTPATDGGMLVVDSILGEVWHIGTQHPERTLWLRDEKLTPLPGIQGLPGVNGIKRFGNRYALSNTVRAQVFTTELDASGRPGPLALLADSLRADDIAFDTNGALYCTTHMQYSLVRVAPGGSRTTLAGAAQGMAGSTAAAFGRTAQDATALYVTTNGGMTAPLEGVIQPAKLVRLEVGVAGAPLLP